MRRRTTIELDQELLANAQRILGTKGAGATVEEALRRVAEVGYDDRADRAARQRTLLATLDRYVDLDVLGSEQMWR